MEQSDKNSELLSFIQRIQTCERRRHYVLYLYESERSSEHVSNSGAKWKN